MYSIIRLFSLSHYQLIFKPSIHPPIPNQYDMSSFQVFCDAEFRAPNRAEQQTENPPTRTRPQPELQVSGALTQTEQQMFCQHLG